MSRRRVFSLLVSVLLVVSILSAGCAPAQPASTAKRIVAYVPAEPPGPEFASALLLGMTFYADKEGFTFVSTAPPQSDIRRQMEIIETYAAEKVAGIFVWPIDSDAIASAIETANKAKVPVIAIDRQINTGELLATIQSDNAQAARLCAEKLIEALTGRYGEPRGKVLHLQAALTTDVRITRSEEFQKVFKDYPKIEVIVKQYQANPEIEKITMDILAANPDVDAIYLIADTGLNIAAGALQQTNHWFTRDDPRHIFTASIDATPVALNQIKAGYYDYSISQPVLHFGLASRIMKEYLDKGTKPKVGDTITEEGAYWSPAQVVQGKNGPLIKLQCIVADSTNYDSPIQWANGLKQWTVK